MTTTKTYKINSLEGYAVWCSIFELKPNRFESLMAYKRFINE